MHEAIQLVITGVLIGSLYAMVALGLTMIYGVLRILHVAHAGMYVIGAYLGLVAYLNTGSYLLSILMAGVAGGLLGVFMERFIYRRMFDWPREVPLVASIGLYMVITELIRIVAGAEPKSFSIPQTGTLSLAGVTVSSFDLSFLIISFIIIGLLGLFLKKTKMGFSIRAISQSREMAQMVGININRGVQEVFFVGSMMAAMAGCLIGPFYSYIDPNMGDTFAYKALAIIVIGGFGSVNGTICASLLLGIMEVLMVAYTKIPLSQNALGMLFLIILLLVKPTGLFGSPGGSH